MRAMMIGTALAVGVLTTVAAWAQNLPGQRPDYDTTNIRNFIVQNASHKVIRQATITFSDGHRRDVAPPAGIRVGQSQNVQADSKACVSKLAVTLTGGKQLVSPQLDACHASQLIVYDDRITAGNTARQ